MVVNVLDVGVVSLHWRLRVLAWGRQCAAAWSVVAELARGGGGVRAAGVGMPVFTRLASFVRARGQRDVASDQLTNELSNSKNIICLPSEPVKRLRTD